MRESKIESYLKKRVKECGGHTRKLRYIACDGAPDRMVLLNGKLHFIELKSSEGRLRKNQVAQLDLLVAYNQSVHVINSIEAVDNFITENTK